MVRRCDAALLGEEALVSKGPEHKKVTGLVDECENAVDHTYPLYKRLLDFGDNTRKRVVVERERLRSRYQWVTLASGLLYGIGWALALAGRLFDVEGIEPPD
jgi:hypothetical protein